MSPTPAVPSLHTGEVEPSSLVERVQGFVSEHRKPILIATAAAVIAAAGFACIQYASASANKQQEGKRKKKFSSKGGKKKNNLDGKDGPILEEKEPVVNGPPGEISKQFVEGATLDSVH